tara:strand:+ start:3097 stop:3945 length:849 start_codon:yes stop_codon:yes gene_type:complete
MKVNTFIVGAPKAGTTSLHYYLSQHTNVSMSSVKEPNYFSSKEVKSLFYNSKCIEDSIEYHKLFSSEKKLIRGEASVSYLFYKEVPKRIHEYNPNSKILIMLRKPTERAFSHYLMDYRLGFCSKKFDDILANPNVHHQFFQQYIELGNYYSQVKEYFKIFGKEQIMIILYDDFKTNTSEVMSKVYNFLKISNNQINFKIKNQFLSSSNKLISNLYKSNLLRKILKIILPKGILSSIKSTFFSNNRRPIFSNDLQKELNKYYENDILKLEKLLNIDLVKWKIK